MNDRPWSNIGIDVGGMSVAQALEDAGLAFNVSVRQGLFRTWANDIEEAKGYNYVVRDDTEQVLGQCKSRFMPVQNKIFVDIAQPFIDSGQAVLDTMGLFGNGARTWMMLKLTNYSMQIENDFIDQYLLFVNGHDGNTAVQVGIVPVRMVCTNMLPRLGRDMIRMKHTENVHEMLQFFTVAIKSTLSKSFESYRKSMRHLNCSFCTCPTEYFINVFGIKESTRGKNMLAVLTDLYKNGRGQEGCTWYDAFNACTEYLSYNAGNSQETRLNSLWFGANDKINSRALALALELAGWQIK